MVMVGYRSRLLWLEKSPIVASSLATYLAPLPAWSLAYATYVGTGSWETRGVSSAMLAQEPFTVAAAAGFVKIFPRIFCPGQ